jgi:predicted CopG family antitoxin
VTSKNISITEDVYEMLSRLKLEGESFSEAIRRLARRSRLSECAGSWTDMSNEEYEAIRGSALKARGLLNESMRRRIEAS